MSSAKRIFISEPYGFCSGVKNALKIVDEALSKYPADKIYVINEIVHNKTIVQDLMNKGVKFVQDASAIPNGSIVIYSAHGVSPKIRAEVGQKQVTVLDAACPLVQKVHTEVNSYSAQGYHIIYICNKNHDEARGVIAENQGNISVVENEADISLIKKGFKKYIVLTQTTLNMYEVEKLFKKIKKLFPGVIFPDYKDLCWTTTTRQKAVQENAQKCDLFLIVGSQNSSNSKKLRDIAARAGCRAYLVDDVHDLRPQWLEQVRTICITSGASAPDYLMDDIIAYLKLKHGYEFEPELKANQHPL